MKTIFLIVLCISIFGASPADAGLHRTAVTLFGLDTRQGDLYTDAADRLKKNIRRSVMAMPRFSVTDLSEYSFKESSVSAILAALQNGVGSSSPFDLFRTADLQKIKSSDAIILSEFRGISYTEHRNEDKTEYSATILVRLVIIDVRNSKISENQDINITLPVLCYSSKEEALSNTIDIAGASLCGALEKMNLFKLRPRIAGIDGSVATLDIGRDFGLSTGDEFSLEKPDKNGKRKQGGLLRLFDVSANRSKGLILWGEMHTNSSLIEYPISPYYVYTGFGQTAMKFQGTEYAPSMVLGFGMHLGYAWKIFLDLAFGFQEDLVGVVVDLGLARRFYAGRFSFDLGASITFGSVNGDARDRFGIRHRDLSQELFGGTVRGSINIQLSRKLILQLNTGYRFVGMSHDDEFDTEYNAYPELKTDLRGPFANIAMIFRL